MTMKRQSGAKLTDRVKELFTEQRLLAVAGFLILGFLACWWTVSFAMDRLAGGKKTWIPCWHWLGCDFEHNYYSSRLWLKGGDPYHSEATRNQLGDEILGDEAFAGAIDAGDGHEQGAITGYAD